MSTLGTVEILERLVGCPTVSRDSNLPLIDWVRNYLDGSRCAPRISCRTTPGASRTCSRASGRRSKAGWCSPVTRTWCRSTGRPGTAIRSSSLPRDSRLYARGACDMKGFIASALSRVPALQAAKLARPVYFMFSYDEEIGCLGAPRMIAAAGERLPKPGAVIVGEPTRMRVANEHKGICSSRTRVTGIEAHSSLTHQGVSAVMLAAEAHRASGWHRARAGAQAAVRSARQAIHAAVHDAQREHDSGRNGDQHSRARLRVHAGTCARCPVNHPTAILAALAEFAERRRRELDAEGKQCTIVNEVLANVPPLEADGGAAEQLARARDAG